MSTCGERGSPAPEWIVPIQPVVVVQPQPDNSVIKKKQKAVKKAVKEEEFNPRKAQVQAWLARKNGKPEEARAAEAVLKAMERPREAHQRWLKTEAGKRHTEIERRKDKLNRILHMNSCRGLCSKGYCALNGCSEEGKVDCRHWMQCRMDECQYPGCTDARQIMKHYRHCWHRRNKHCEICGWHIGRRMDRNRTLRRDPIPDAA